MLSFSMVVFLLIGILFMGLPVAFSLGGTSLLLIALFDLPMKIVGATIFTSLDSFTILSIPLFVLMSQVLLDGRIGDAVVQYMRAMDVVHTAYELTKVHCPNCRTRPQRG